jgi:branched-chain amino acid transport system substrate-binding protein
MLCAAMMTFGAAGCSLSLDFEECSTDSDCAARGPGMVCSQERFCVERSSLKDQIPLTNKECGAVFGPAEDADTLLIGTLLPVSGDNAAIGKPMEEAVKLAVKEFNEHGGIAGRKLAVVLCDTGGNADKGVAAAQHLVDVGVPAAIGPAFSGVFLEVASRFAAPGPNSPYGLVLVSPSATNPAISSLADADRAWRTVPSDALQGKAMSHLLQASTSYGLPEISRVTVVYKDDAYGTGLLSALVESLPGPAEGGPELTPVKYADPTKEKVYASDLFEKVDATAPEIVVLIGTAETAQILPFFEFAWRNRAEPVWWLLSDGGKTETLFTEVADPKKNLDVEGVLARIRGTAPANAAGKYFNGFKARLAGEYGYPEPPVYTPQSYDAAYMIGLALTTTEGTYPSSADVVAGLRRLTGGTEVIPAAPDFIPKAAQILASADASLIDFDGASGPLQFDANGEAPGAIDLWSAAGQAFQSCALLDSSAKPVPADAGGCIQP